MVAARRRPRPGFAEDTRARLRALLHPPARRDRARPVDRAADRREQHGGSVIGRQRPERRGGVVTVRLPLADRAAALGRAARTWQDTAEDPAGRRRPRDPLRRPGLPRAARLRGRRGGGAAAARRRPLRQAPPRRAILLDYLLPDGNALELLPRLTRDRADGPGGHPHRPRLDRPRGAGDQGRRRAVPHQAGRAAGAARGARAAAREPAQTGAAAGGQVRRVARRPSTRSSATSAGDPQLAGAGREAWSSRRQPGADPGRDRHRQGRAGALAARPRPARATRRSSTSTAPGCRASSSRPSCSATRRGAFTGAVARKAGLLEVGAPRHGVPRRDRRHGLRGPAQAAEGARGEALPPPRRGPRPRRSTSG